MQTKIAKTLFISRMPSYVVTAILVLLFQGCSTINDPSVKTTLNPEERAVAAVQIPSRISNVNAHDKKVNALLGQARDAWAIEDLDRLQTIYEALDAVDEDNLRAKQGLKRVAMARHHLVLLAEAKALLGQSEADDLLAKEKLHRILLERPNHHEAYALYDDLIKKEAIKQEQKAKVKLGYNKSLSLEFRDIKLNMLFEALSKITNVSFILDKNVKTKDKANLFVKNMAFSDILDLVCQTNQLRKKVLSETSVIIYPNKPTSKRSYEDLSVRNFPLEYADAKQVSATLRSMLGIKKIEMDERLSSLMIKETPAVLALAEKVIRTLDRPDPEVMLEMEVLEVRRSRLQDLGLDVPTRLGVPIPNGGLTWEQLRDTTVNQLIVGGTPGINFSSNDSDVSLLANPRIRVKNKEIAKIHVGEKVPVFTANIASTGVSSQTVQYIDAGLKLEAQPTISSSGDVTIKINLNVGSIGDQITNGQSTAFRFGTRTASTKLRLHDGETQILAGLIDDQDRTNIDKIPGLGDIPILGRLFGKNRDNKSKTEIVLSITPHIIREKPFGSADENEYWIGAEGDVGRKSVTPTFKAGDTPPFMVPRPASAVKKTDQQDKPQNLNIPLPPGFSLGSDAGDMQSIQ